MRKLTLSSVIALALWSAAILASAQASPPPKASPALSQALQGGARARVIVVFDVPEMRGPAAATEARRARVAAQIEAQGARILDAFHLAYEGAGAVGDCSGAKIIYGGHQPHVPAPSKSCFQGSFGRWEVLRDRAGARVLPRPGVLLPH